MASFQRWTRLHAVPLDRTLGRSVRAEIADPAWLLGRQWQLGELRHDAGSPPVFVDVRGTTSPFVVAGADAGVPTEVAVEREPVPEYELVGLRLRRESGQHLVRLLRLAKLGARVATWVDRCPFPGDASDPVIAEWLRVFGPRVPDAARARAEAMQAIGPPATVDAAEAAVLKAWLDWDAARFHQAPSAWNPARLGYEARAAAANGTTRYGFATSGLPGGHHDWAAWDTTSDPPPDLKPKATPFRLVRVASPLQFPGQPDARFWSFEDPSLRFDALPLVSGPSPSPAASLVVDFALRTGNDWFLAPVPVPAGHAIGIDEVLVTDAFGDKTVLPVPAGPSLFHSDNASSPNDSPLALSATGLGTVIEGPPLETVHLLRDEIANVGWAVEYVVPTALGEGRTLDTTLAPPNPDPSTDKPAWRLSPEAPPRTWFPLIPQANQRLVRGVHWGALDAQPQSTIVSEIEAVGGLEPRVIPPEGRVISRGWQRARSADGRVHQWVGRRVGPRPERSVAAVLFDQVEGSIEGPSAEDLGARRTEALPEAFP
ncbi:MAG: hypothetical protein MUF34_00500 [Polyangiaceae bacterium]|jgi:hypothetical protein|nr:hypothetical protein [Polyangiaceae bacterium]